MARMAELPPEILYHIFLCVSPISLPSLLQVCRKFSRLSIPLIWRHHCRNQFRFWDSSHQMLERHQAIGTTIDWKALFTQRYYTDRSVQCYMDSLLACQTGRIAKAESIIGYGYDAKDTLLQGIRTDTDAADVLARRYYSDAVLGLLHRKMALEILFELGQGHDVPLEKALGSLDLFVLHDRGGDLNDISQSLDQIAQDFSISNAQCSDQSSRNQAVNLAKYLKTQELTGIDSDVDNHYHDLQNNFLGIALRDENHPSLPLISASIFCCVAQRLGINAQPCGFPFHVLAIVKPPQGEDLAGKIVDDSVNDEVMYLDPFRSGEEVVLQDLIGQLSSLRVPQQDHSELLGPSKTADVVRRSAKNIITSVQSLSRSTSDLSAVVTFPEIDGAFYAALWVLILLPEGSAITARRQRARILPHLRRHLETQFKMDIVLFDKYLPNLFNDEDEAYQLFRDSISDLRTGDSLPKQVKKRVLGAKQSVRYQLGQIFHHKRYFYKAIIIGWDVECTASDAWMSNMRVHELTGGKKQSFYHVMVEDKSVRYVAEENVCIIREPGKGLIALAGQYFKRWDNETCTFINNIRDEYPDD